MKISLPITDPQVQSTVNKLRAALLLNINSDSDRQLIMQYVKSNVCNINTSGGPGNSVGNFLCGCFGNNGLKPSCTASCALSPFSDFSCSSKVLYFGRDGNGNFSSKILSEADTTSCNVFIEPNVQFTNEQRLQALSEAGCQQNTYYNAMNNSQLLVSEVNQTVPASQEIPPTAGQPSVSDDVVGATTSSKVSVAYGSGGSTVPTVSTPAVSSYSAGGFSLWVTFAIVLFILIILVIAFVWWRSYC
jgi:hypothetical protein